MTKEFAEEFPKVCQRNFVKIIDEAPKKVPRIFWRNGLSKNFWSVCWWTLNKYSIKFRRISRGGSLRNSWMNSRESRTYFWRNSENNAEDILTNESSEEFPKNFSNECQKVSENPKNLPENFKEFTENLPMNLSKNMPRKFQKFSWWYFGETAENFFCRISKVNYKEFPEDILKNFSKKFQTICLKDSKEIVLDTSKNLPRNAQRTFLRRIRRNCWENVCQISLVNPKNWPRIFRQNNFVRKL